MESEVQKYIVDCSIVKEEYVVKEEIVPILIAKTDGEFLPKPPKTLKPAINKIKTKKHICSHCGKAFQWRRDVRFHITKHSKEKKFQCTKCLRAYADQSRLNIHLRLHSNEHSHECKLCWKIFKNAEYLRLHLKRHLGIRNHECPVCGKKFIDTRNWRYHMQKVHEEVKLKGLPRSRWTCDICGTFTMDKCSFEKHLLSHSDVKTAECPICQKKFKHESYLKTHMNTHGTERPFLCVICGKGFKTKVTHRSHQVIHSNEFRKCPYCNKMYKYKETFKRHIWNHHRGLPFEIKALQKHVIIHADELPFVCELCGKGFKDKRKLRTHIRLMHERYSQNRVLKCPQCGKGCRGETFLAMHQAIHNNEALFECAICSKKFKKKSQIKQHVLTHSKSRKMYSCQICGIERTSARSIRKHEAKHNSEGTLKCPAKKCQMIFCHIKNRNEHIEKEHKEFKYICKICGDMVKHRKNLREHDVKHRAEGRTKRYKPTKTVKKIKKEVKMEEDVKIEVKEIKSEPQENLPRKKEKKHICAICGKSFYHPRDIRYHMSVHSTERNFHCPKCPKRFTSDLRMRTHLRIHETDGIFPCKLCGKIFKNSEYLRIHLNRHAGIKKFECTVCGLMLAEARNLKQHMLRFHQEETVKVLPKSQFTCDHCGKDCLDKKSYKGHILSHSDVRNVPCPVCQKMYKSEDHVKAHMKVHNKYTPFACIICNHAVKTRGNLAKHMWTHHRGIPTDYKEGPVACTACNETFKNFDALQKHVIVHSEEKPYQCPTCGNCYRHHRSMRNHIREVHEDNKERPNRVLKCPQCGKGCKGQTFLALHLATHSNEAQFECAICSKKFKLKSHIRLHVVRHSKERKMYSCRICGVERTSARSIRSHEAKHNSRKYFNCLAEDCKLIFSNKKARNDHILKDHTEFQYTCGKCKDMVKDEEHLREHEKMCKNDGKKPYREKHSKDKSLSKGKKDRISCDKEKEIREKKHICAHCGKAFMWRRDIRFHITKHSKEKKFKCPHCPRRYPDKHRRDVHSKLHGNPHECKLCGKVFQNSRYLKLHLQRHLGLKRFECDICSRKFPEARNWRYHMERVHQVDSASVRDYNTRSKKTDDNLIQSTIIQKTQIKTENATEFGMEYPRIKIEDDDSTFIKVEEVNEI
uniref:C2H2-type domain-containing protein n=1 Tax=Phlebotomus papatasi TaxID=29031 RepID=A0A1B0D2D0_PHLPP